MGIFRTSTHRRKVTSSTAPDGVHPICPYCAQRIDTVYAEEVSLPPGKTWLYFCSRCSKVLGASQRKTVPMG